MLESNKEKPPKTLIDGTRRKAERNCAGLRTYETPPDVKVFDLNGNFLRTEPPTEIKYTFNGRKNK